MKIKKCRVCGKEYEVCRKQTSGFNYKEVACSPACGEKYFKKVEKARRVQFPKIDTDTNESEE